MRWNGVVVIALVILPLTAQAGGVLEPVPNEPPPYFAGETVSVDVWLHNQDGVGHDLIIAALDVTAAAATVYAGGLFSSAGGVNAEYIAKWDGNRDLWQKLGTGLDVPLSRRGPVLMFGMQFFDDGTGSKLYAAGIYINVGAESTNYVVRWDGMRWSNLGGALGQYWARTFVEFDDGTGSALYVGGNFAEASGGPVNRIGKWDGASWLPLGAGTHNEGSTYPFYNAVHDLAVFDDGTGPALYAGGYFLAAGAVTANSIARWDGMAWSALGSGVNKTSFGTTVRGEVSALAVFDDGTGPALYVAGTFTLAGGSEALNIARWDGTSWSAVGGGMDEIAVALAVWDDGTGQALYAGGNFTTAGGAPASHIAKWDGAAWSPLGSGVDEIVYTIAGSQRPPVLFAGGWFTMAGGVAADHIAAWDGTAWSELGGGTDDWVRTLMVSDDTDGTSPMLTLDPTFEFDFSTLSDGGAAYLMYTPLPGPGILYAAPSPVPGSILHLPAGGSLRIGTMNVVMPSTPGTYALDVANPSGAIGGAVLSFGFGGPGDPYTSWSARTGGLTGESVFFQVTVPAPPTTPAGEEAFAKNRYLSVLPTNSGEQTALRVTLTDSLMFPAAIGSQWWVGSPSSVSENSGSVAPIQGSPDFMAARLQCDPHPADWDLVLGSGVAVHVYGSEVVPDATYAVEAIHEASDIGDPASFSTPLVVPTAKWGDIVLDCSVCPCGAPSGAVDIVDVLAVLSKFQNVNCAPIKARCDLDPELVNLVVSISDVTNVSNAFSSVPYPFGGPIPCP